MPDESVSEGKGVLVSIDSRKSVTSQFGPSSTHLKRHIYISDAMRNFILLVRVCLGEILHLFNQIRTKK